MKALVAVLGFFGSLAQKIAPSCAPLWRAWDWLTGRSTFTLAKVLGSAWFAWAVVDSAMSSEWFLLACAPAAGYYLRRAIVVLECHAQSAPSDVVPLEVMVERQYLEVWCGLVLVVLSVELVLFWNWHHYGVVGRDCILILCHQAALASEPGSGKHVLARAADRLRASIPRLIPAPVAGS